MTSLLQTTFHSRRALLLGVLGVACLPVSLPAHDFAPETPPPREVIWEEIDWEPAMEGIKPLSPIAQQAYGFEPDDWHHAETDNYILHYRRKTEARKVSRRIEHDLWFIAGFLGFEPGDYQSKSHAFIFEDTGEWLNFLQKIGAPENYAAFAYGDELYLNVRDSGRRGRFDEQTLAHETAHAIVARLYPNRPWPLWLNEGFAGYMETASVAARRGRHLGSMQPALTHAEMPLETLFQTTRYPPDPQMRHAFYQTAEKLVRFLVDEHDYRVFPGFIQAVLQGEDPSQAYRTHYRPDNPGQHVLDDAFEDYRP
jgi:hypothetical protein